MQEKITAAIQKITTSSETTSVAELGSAIAALIDSIDSALETGDDAMNKEFRTTLLTIIWEEKKLQTPEQKTGVETDIVAYVQESVKDAPDAYVQLPYHLITAAKKAGIGDVEKYMFGWKDGKLVVCSSQQYVGSVLTFSQDILLQKEYLTPVYDSFSALPDQMQTCCTHVDTAKEKLQTLLAKGHG